MSSEWTVYAIRHGPSGVAYYGRTQNLASTWRNYRKKLSAQIHPNAELQAVWDFYRPEEFAASTLAEGLTKAEAKELVDLIIEHAGGMDCNTPRPVEVEGVVYRHVADAAKRLGMNKATVRRRVLSGRREDYRRVI